MILPNHPTTKDGYGPGTFVDTAFHSVPDESRRLLRLLASQTPGFTQDEAALSAVKFFGDDLPIIPGPLKSQAMVRLPKSPPYLSPHTNHPVCRTSRHDWHRRQRDPRLEEHQHRSHQHRHHQSWPFPSDRGPRFDRRQKPIYHCNRRYSDQSWCGCRQGRSSKERLVLSYLGNLPNT